MVNQNYHMLTDEESEAAFQRLIAIGTTHNLEGVREYRKQGGKVVGLLSDHIPEEVLYAGGILPWHMVGSMGESTPLAGVHRPPMTDAYNTHVLQAIISGELDFLDSMVATNFDDDCKAAWAIAKYVGKPPSPLWLEIPVTSRQIAVERFAQNIAQLRRDVERQFEVRISDENLADAITIYNSSRRLLHRLYEMRKQDNPPLTGVEVWGIVSAAMSMPQGEFVRQLEPLLPYIGRRQSSVGKGSIRILLSCNYLHNVEYIRLIENLGGLVVIDESDVGSRYFWEFVNEDRVDNLNALAARYLNSTSSPRMDGWPKQIEQIIGWASEFKVDGFVEMAVWQSLPRMFRSEYLFKNLESARIPALHITREYHLANVAQIAIRVEAFLEMLGEGRV